MTRTDYIDRVLVQVHRVTPGERAAIRRELADHLEDHAQGLLDLGWDRELVEERTLAAMGDPAEMGRELNRQYPFFWLAVKWAAVALTAGFALLMLLPGWGLVRDTVVPNLWMRFAPLHELDLRYASFGDTCGEDGTWKGLVEESVNPGLRQTEDGMTMYVYQAGLEDPVAEETNAWLAVGMYCRNPMEKMPLWMEEFRVPGKELYFMRIGTQGPCILRVPVSHGETVQLFYERYGHRYAFTVELPWKEAEP